MEQYFIVVFIAILIVQAWYHFRIARPIRLILMRTGQIIGLYETFFKEKLENNSLDDYIKDCFSEYPEESTIVIRSRDETNDGIIQIYRDDTAKDLLDAFSEVIENTITCYEENRDIVDEDEFLSSEMDKVFDIYSKIRVANWKQQTK